MVFVDPSSVLSSIFLFSGNPWGGMPSCCNVIAIREEETQEEYSSNRGVAEPWIWLMCEQNSRSRSIIEE